jgi:CheY-like chemotaxis protein
MGNSYNRFAIPHALPTSPDKPAPTLELRDRSREKPPGLPYDHRNLISYVGFQSLFESSGGLYQYGLTDIMMPCVDGVALIRAIKKMKPEMVFIASTGQGQETRVSELHALGDSNFLGKPYDTQTLLKTVGATLNSARSNPVHPS